MFDKAEGSPQEFRERTQVLRGIAAYINEYDKALSGKYFEIIEEIERVVRQQT